MRLSFLTKQLPQDQKDRSSLEVYGCLTGVALLFVLARTFILLSCFLRCSERLHDKMVVAILKAPVMFFDSNPVGRILNRFSKDVGWLDEQLPKTFQSAIDTVLLVSASIIIPTVMNPWLFFVLVLDPLSTPSGLANIFSVYAPHSALQPRLRMHSMRSLRPRSERSHRKKTCSYLETSTPG